MRNENAVKSFESLRLYSYFVIGKSEILFLLGNGKSFGFKKQ
jgi:hypothetical protein